MDESLYSANLDDFKLLYPWRIGHCIHEHYAIPLLPTVDKGLHFCCHFFGSFGTR